MTYIQARDHLQAIIEMCTRENLYLACVREYLRNVNVDVIHGVRAQEFKKHEKIIEILDLQSKAEDRVRNFLVGQVFDA